MSVPPHLLPFWNEFLLATGTADHGRYYDVCIFGDSEKLADELATLAARSDVGATASFAAEVMALDLRPQLGAIKVPVVSVSPFHAPDFARIGVDEAGKTGYYRWLLAGVEKLDVVSISPARHFVMFDQPEKFAVALDQVLANMFESPTK